MFHYFVKYESPLEHTEQENVIMLFKTFRDVTTVNRKINF